MKLNDEFINSIIDTWDNLYNIIPGNNVSYIIELIKKNPKYRKVEIVATREISGISTSIGDAVVKIGSKICSPELDNIFPCLDKILKICEYRSERELDQNFYHMGSNVHMVTKNKIEIYFITHYQKSAKSNIMRKIKQFFEMENEEEFHFYYWKVAIEID
jgi:hypothetical protein